MVPLHYKMLPHMHMPKGHNMLLWLEHMAEDEHFWVVVAWIVLILTFAFFATTPLY
jgi:hypothetical protein